MKSASDEGILEKSRELLKYYRHLPIAIYCFVTAAVGCNALTSGCVQGYPGVLLPQLYRPGTEIPVNTTSESWITSVSGPALLVGNFVTLPIMGRLGRKAAHLAVCLPQLLGWMLIALAPNIEILIAGRMLTGLAAGMLLPLRSPLIGECTTPKHRGAFLITISLTQTFGILFVHLIGSLMHWQPTAFVCMFFPFISLIMIIYSPESPSWLLSQGRYDECRTVFRWLRGDGEEEELEAMIRARILFEKEANGRKENKVNLFRRTKEVFVKKEFYKPIITLFHLYLMRIFSGGVVMASYSIKILDMLLGSTGNAYFWMIFIDTLRFFSNAFAIYVISKVKRRTMLFSAGALCIVSKLAIAAYSYTRASGMFTYEAMWLPIVFINIQMFTVAVSLITMPVVISGEIFPLEYRSISNCISLAAITMFSFICLKTFPGLISSIGLHGTYLTHVGFLVYAAIVCWFMLPETKGKTLQQIEDEYRTQPLSPEEMESGQLLQMNPVREERGKPEHRCSNPKSEA